MRRAKRMSVFKQDYDNYGGNPSIVFNEFETKNKGPYVSPSSDVDMMDGHDFEYFCADILRKNGYSNVEVTKGSGDYGVDIFAKKNEVTYAIQCKRYNGNVGNKAVQEALSGSMYYGCDRAVVLTNRYFTEQAKETAHRTNVILWDRDTLSAMIQTVGPYDAAYLRRTQARQSTYSSYGNAFHRKFESRVGCLIPIAVIVVGILCLVAVQQKAETKKREEKKEIIVSAVNKDEDPSATINNSNKKEDSTNKESPIDKEELIEISDQEKTGKNVEPISVIVDGVCYIKTDDHLEVVGLSDFRKTNVIIQQTIDGLPVTVIRSEAFSEEDIISVYLPPSITEIQNSAFSSCRKLASINLPDGLTTIAQNTFILCQSLQFVAIPDTVTSIESGAFCSTALASIDLKNVLSIGTDAFSGCKLYYVNLPSCLQSIGDRAFNNNIFLQTIAIPEGVETIGKECFQYCKNLISVSLPETLTSIGKRCFWGCSALTEIRIPSNVKDLNNSQMFEMDLTIT